MSIWAVAFRGFWGLFWGLWAVLWVGLRLGLGRSVVAPVLPVWAVWGLSLSPCVAVPCVPCGLWFIACRGCVPWLLLWCLSCLPLWAVFLCSVGAWVRPVPRAILPLFTSFPPCFFHILPFIPVKNALFPSRLPRVRARVRAFSPVKMPIFANFRAVFSSRVRVRVKVEPWVGGGSTPAYF